MVTVPTPAQQGQPVGSVQTQPANTPFINVRPADTSARGRDMQTAGSALMQLGQTLQRKRDDTALREAEVAMNELERELLNPQTGIHTRRGGDAAGVTAQVSDRFGQFRSEAMQRYGGGLSGSGREALEQYFEGAEQRMWRRAATHELAETYAHEQNLISAQIEGQVDRASFLYNDPDEVLASRLQVESLAGDLADAQGLKGEAREQFVETQVAALHAQVATRMAANGDAVKAEAYINELMREGKIDATDGAALWDKIRPLSVAQQGNALGRQEFDRLNSTAPAGSSTPSRQALVQTAEQVLNMDETAQNEAIREYLANGGVNLDPAVTAWCAGFVNATLNQQGVQGTGTLAARDFLKWGEGTDTPQRGDVVVLSRGDPDGWQGHVGFFMGFDAAGNPLVLGGNQGGAARGGGAVTVQAYDKGRVLGYRTAGQGKAPPGGSVISEHADPEVRAAAAAEMERLMALQYKQQNRAQGQAVDAIYAEIEAANLRGEEYNLDARLAQSPELVDILGDKLNGVREFARNRGEPETNTDVYAGLQIMSEARPGEFAQTELWRPEYRNNLSPQDYKAMVDKQAKILGERTEGTGGGAVTITDLRRNIGGITTGLKPEERGFVEQRMEQYIQSYTATTGSPPDAIAQYEQAERLAASMRNETPFVEDTGFFFADDDIESILQDADEAGLPSLLERDDLVFNIPGPGGTTNRVDVDPETLRNFAYNYERTTGRAPRPSQVLQMVFLIESGELQ